MENDVRERRAARGLSQGDLGKALGVSRQTINAIETGRYLPSLPLAMAMARYFDASVEQIFRSDDGEVR
jgi:putative transcriptional regulator